MEILVDRKWKKDTYTIGSLYINGEFFSNTLEDKDRGLASDMPLEQLKKIKKSGVTAIPTGTYKVNMNTVSPRFSKNTWYVQNCHRGKVPRLEDVPGFSGVLIHVGNTAADTDGCILIGKNDVKGKVTKSKDYFLKLYNTLYEAFKNNEEITITIK